MEKTKKLFILLIVLILIFLLIYTPHLTNPFPIHIDEWHHITEAIKIKQGEIPKGLASIKAGFHFFLMILSYPANLVLIYKFFPTIWAVFTALILFFIIRKKTSNLKSSFIISVFTIIFFASIKSNANITGLWFFTPLTFSIPFIFLYIHLFSEGIRIENKKYILFSLLIMLILIPIHSISVLFAIPFLIIYSLIHYKYLIKEYKLFLLFLLIPIIGILFFSFIMEKTLLESITQLIKLLQFRYGWGVLELKNSFFELYSLVGYLLAILGIIYIISSKTKLKKYLIYLLWPTTVLIYILVFRITGISFLSPYQRNLYYFAISLPFLSALGFYTILKYIKIQTNKIQNEKSRKQVYKIISILLIIIILILTFESYYSIPQNIKLYKIINKDNYEALLFLKTQPKPENNKVMAPASISTALYPISGYEPVGTIFFYGNREDVDRFFEPKPEDDNCQTKDNLIRKYNVSYILSEKQIDCSTELNWKVIYNKNNNVIYKVY